MSYDIYLYHRGASQGEPLAEPGDEPPIPEWARERIAMELVERGYVLESTTANYQEFTHPRAEWGLQVCIFENEIAFSMPYWDDVQAALASRCGTRTSWRGSATSRTTIRNPAKPCRSSLVAKA